MSDLIKVDTGVVVSVANAVSRYNQSIRADFTHVETAMRILSSHWKSDAATHAMEAFHKLKNDFSEPRYNEINNFVKYLVQIIGDGYNVTEEGNKKLSDAFK
jgi:hypothetical protein